MLHHQCSIFLFCGLPNLFTSILDCFLGNSSYNYCRILVLIYLTFSYFSSSTVKLKMKDTHSNWNFTATWIWTYYMYCDRVIYDWTGTLRRVKSKLTRWRTGTTGSDSGYLRPVGMQRWSSWKGGVVEKNSASRKSRLPSSFPKALISPAAWNAVHTKHLLDKELNTRRAHRNSHVRHQGAPCISYTSLLWWDDPWEWKPVWQGCRTLTETVVAYYELEHIRVNC